MLINDITFKVNAEQRYMRMGARDKRGRKVYGRREKRGRKGGEIGELRNIFQLKKSKEAEAKKIDQEPGWKGTGGEKFQPPCPPPPKHKHSGDAKY